MRALVLLLLSSLALADESPKERARALFKDGDAAYSAGKYDEAIAKYNQAFALVPLPLLLFDLGQAYRMRGEREKAVEHYRKYLDVDPNGKGAAEAREHLEELSAQIEKDRAAAAARKAAAEEARRSEEAQRAERARVQAEEQRKAAAQRQADLDAHHQAELRARAVSKSERPTWKKPWVWATIGVAAAVVAVSIGVGVAYGGAERDPTPSLGRVPAN